MSQHQPRDVAYNFEYDRKLKACFIGAGGHAYRNVYPTFRYAPIDLVAVCDLNKARAQSVGSIFGAQRAYDNHREMLAAEKPDVVFIVTNYDETGRVRATALAKDCAEAGAHVWMEKPTAATRAEVEELIEVSARTGRNIMTGLKKTFFPSIEKLKDIVTAPSFGRLTSLIVRYPQELPPPERRKDLVAMKSFVDHIYHFAAILNFIGGEIEYGSFEWAAETGASIASLKFKSGAVGALHLSAGQSRSGPLERVEAIGEGEHAIVENGVRLTHYRKVSTRPTYGRASSWILPEDSAPVFYEPEFSLGQLYNNNMFTLGYVPEVLHFSEAVLSGQAITKGTLAEALTVMKLYDFYANTPHGVRARI